MRGDIIKKPYFIFKTLTIGLCVSTVLYPLLHELGHYVMAILCGIRVIEFCVLPVPYVLCEMKEICSFKLTIIGVGGTVFPILFSAVISPKLFSLWYANIVIKAINIIALMLEFASVIFYRIGYPIPNDDTTAILKIASDEWILLIGIYLILLLLCIFSLIKTKPFKQIFNISQ